MLLLSSQSAASISTYLLAVFALINFKQWDDILSDSLFWWVIAFVAYFCLSSFWSNPVRFDDVLSISIRGILVLFFVISFAQCQLRGQLRRWLGSGLALIGGLVALVTISNFYISDPIDGRLNGLGVLDTHVIAALVFGTTSIIALDASMSSAHKFRLVAHVVSIALMLAAVFLSDSRNAWVSTFTGLSVYILTRVVSKGRDFWLTCLVLAICFSAALIGGFMNPESRELLFPRGDSFRLDIWHSVLLRIYENPIFGSGILTNDDVHAGSLVFQHAHNLYLSLLFQGGVFGLSLFIGLIVFCLKTLTTSYQERDAKVALAIFSLALTSFLLDGHEVVDKIGESWFMVWLPVAICVGIHWKNGLRRQ